MHLQAFNLPAGIESPVSYLAASLSALSSRAPGVLPPRLAALDEPHRRALQAYLNMYSVQLC